MALKEYYFEYEKTVASNTWNINFSDLKIPDDALYASVTEVFATGGEIIQLDSQLVAPDGLQLSFGVTSVSGKAIGKYYLESNDQTVVTDSAGNMVNITVTQNGGSDPVGSTF